MMTDEQVRELVEELRKEEVASTKLAQEYRDDVMLSLQYAEAARAFFNARVMLTRRASSGDTPIVYVVLDDQGNSAEAEHVLDSVWETEQGAADRVRRLEEGRPKYIDVHYKAMMVG